MDCRCLAKSLVNDPTPTSRVGSKVAMFDKGKFHGMQERTVAVNSLIGFLILAEKELLAFISAVDKLFGAEQAHQSCCTGSKNLNLSTLNLAIPKE